MDKEFEEWKQESVDDEMRAGLEIAGEYFDLDYLWNAAKEISKQYWLDKVYEDLKWAAEKLDAHTGDLFLGNRLRERIKELD